MRELASCRLQMLLSVIALSLLITALGIAAEPIADDRDWRGPAAAARAEGIEREMTPELLLKTELKDPVLLFDPTEDETITHITDFKGRLYLASCTQPAATATGSIFTYDPEAHQWQKVFQVNEEGLVRLEVYGDRLYIAGYDAEDGGWDLGNIYVHDGETWVEHRTVPRAVHIYGLAVYRDRIYVSADIFDEPPPRKTVEVAADEGLPIYGRVVSSGDGGLTWREEYRGAEEGQDIGFMTVFQNRLVTNVHGDLMTFDGRRWRRLGLNPDALIVFDFADAGDVLLLGTSLGLGLYDGSRFRLAGGSYGSQIRAICRFGSYWGLAEYRLTGGTIWHGPGLMSYPSSPDRSREPFYAMLRLVPEERIHAAARGRLARGASAPPVQRVSSPEMLTSAHAFRGRLYLGTHPEGRVLVLPVVKEGTLESAPHAVRNPGKYRLTWEAATPPGTSCQLQVRSAPSAEVLETLPFVGPDGKAESYFAAPEGAFEIATPGFVQYRVKLNTEDPAFSPYLKRVTITPAE